MNNVEYSFLISFLAGISTLVGCFLIFLKKTSNKVISGSLAFASGVMITVSLTDLIPSSFHLLNKTYFPIFSILLIATFFTVGVIFSMLVDKYLPEEKGKSGLYRVGIFSMLAIILHNIPEGIATFMASNVDRSLGLSFNISSNTTIYGLYNRTLTLTYYDNSTSAKTKTGTQYWAPAGNVNPSFTMTQSDAAGWSEVGWATSYAADASVAYANGATITLTGNLTIYGRYNMDVTLTYYDNSTTAKYKYGTVYNNVSNNGSLSKYPSFTMTQASASGWTARGWSTTNRGDAGISYANGASISISSNTTIYGLYSQSITLSYSGNGATSGSVSSESKTRYWAPAGYINPTFTLKANGFSRSGYAFTGWNLGAVGASVTLSASTTATAQWIQNYRLIYANELTYYPNTSINWGQLIGEVTPSITQYQNTEYITYQTEVPFVAFSGGFRTTNAIDFTPFSTLKITFSHSDFSHDGGYERLNFGYDSNYSYEDNTHYKLLDGSVGCNGAGTYTVDISGVTGSKYIIMELTTNINRSWPWMRFKIELT